MRVLLCAYACLPEKGSEPGIGWSWARELSKLGHEVTVITRASGRGRIQKYIDNASADDQAWLKNVSFEFFDLHMWCQFGMVERIFPFKFGKHFLWHIWHYPYHFFWQIRVLGLARTLHARTGFDLVHLITLGTLRRSSFLGRLKIPFLLGPVGGGERAPWKLRWDLGIGGWISDFVRDLSIYSSAINPFVWLMCRDATHIYVKTEESSRLIPPWARGKASVQLELGLNPGFVYDLPAAGKGRSSMKPLRVLYVGRFLHWKGMDYGIRAFSELVKRTKQSHQLVMVGQGPSERRWRELVDRLGLSDLVQWIPWVSQSDLKGIYDSCDVLLFPSLHDSSGNVVLEALTHALPVVCLDLGGPGTIVTNSCGVKVPTNDQSGTEVVGALADGLVEIASNPGFYAHLSEGARSRSLEFVWPRVVGDCYANFLNRIARKP